MDKKNWPKMPFAGVALALIIVGAVTFAVGSVEWAFSLFGKYDFGYPFLKFLGGLIVISFGYIILELELLRSK